MALVVFGSQKGSPGASLTALVVAASWPTDPTRRTLLVEADPDGGVLAIRYQLGREPGLLSLAASGRHGVARSDLWSHTQELPGGLAAVVAPDRPDQATAALHAAGATLGAWLQSLPDVDVIADVGRLSPSSPALSFAAAADMILMVARPTAEQIQPAAERINTLQTVNPSVGWCLIGESPHTPNEIERVHKVTVVGVLADDPRGAAALERGGSDRRIRRSALIRSASELSVSIAGWVHRNQPRRASNGSTHGWDVVDDSNRSTTATAGDAATSIPLPSTPPTPLAGSELNGASTVVEAALEVDRGGES